MKNKVCCKGCKEDFEDGEIIGIVNNEIYHCSFETQYDVKGCFKKTNKTKSGIYYQGKIYNIFDVVKLDNFKQLKGMKTAGLGTKINGDLGGLLKQKVLVS
jgi:hypothetical protein